MKALAKKSAAIKTVYNFLLMVNSNRGGIHNLPFVRYFRV